ncbi:energy transducer TonB [Fusobacterium ulcerans]|uniref:TonB family domain-containing protein n=1 Tax=Fusobacterium ulcerans 12-1B TaxID=457404 RepID=H1PS65_9FUSO|nr:energy transducer TonB [Fusobacterium ulcerans]EHO82014.1 TonB family domain-containing protein [Fusobacterium ulcerans 12-1B]
MKRYFIIALLLHGMLFFKLSLPTVTKDLDTKENSLKQSVPVTFTQVSKAAPIAAAPPQPVAEPPKPKEIPKKEVKPETPKPVPKKTIPKKDIPKKETVKEPEAKEVKEASETSESSASNTSTGDHNSSIPSINSLLTANADGTYNAVSNHGIKYKITREITPTYPKQAENIRYRKKVIVKAKFLVDQSGNVKNISIIDSHSKLGFDQAVIDALGKWKFSPIVFNGKVISVYFQKEFVFEPKS